MKKIYSYIGGLLLVSVLAFMACSPEDFPSVSEGGIPIASSYEDAVEILVDQETNQVTFNLNSKGCMPVWIIDGKTYSTVNGLKKIYTKSGDYTVDVKIANMNGISDGTFTKTFHVDNTIIDFTKYITFLSGGTSKEWMVAKDEAGHLGCGETGTDGLGWYSATANEKADMGLYDDIVTFDSEKNYTYNPGEGGTVFVNTGCSAFSEFNPNDGKDFMATVSEQKATYDFDVVGNDLYITFPSQTLFPYIANDAIYQTPRYRVLSMDTKKMELVSDNGEIAWHYTLTCDNTKTFTGFKYNHDCNMWKSAVVAEPAFYYAPGWVQIANPEYTLNGSTYKVTLPIATTEKWQAQMPLVSDVATNSATTYDFSVILTSSKNHGNVTVKLVDSADDGIYYFEESLKLKAYEDYVFYRSDMPGLDIDNVKLVFDFGGNETDTEMTIKNIVVKEHSCDDGTVLPAEEPEEPEPEVTWTPDGPANFWNGATITNEFYYAPGWNQIADPDFEVNGNIYKVTLPEPTTDQWQAQVKFLTDMQTTVDKTYDFRIIMNSTQNIKGATVKLVQHGDDNTFYFAEKVELKAYEDVIFQQINMAGLDMSAVDLVLDFGGCPASTEVTVSGIILQEHNGPVKINWNYDSACNMWKSSKYTNDFYYAPGWTPIENPGFEASGSAFNITLPNATTDQWQAQVKFLTDMTTNASTSYDFHCVLNSSQKLKATLKMVLHGDDNAFYFVERVDLAAYEDYTIEQTAMPGIDMNNVDFVLDFGSNPDNTEVTVSNIILKESSCNE